MGHKLPTPGRGSDVAGYMLKFDRPHKYSVMRAIKKMAEETEKKRLVAQAGRSHRALRRSVQSMMDKYCEVRVKSSKFLPLSVAERVKPHYVLSAGCCRGDCFL